MEWNEVGRAHSAGGPSQQGLLPKVLCTAYARGVLTRMTKYQRTKDPGLCALGAYIAGDTLRHQPMGVGHVTALQLCGPMGLHVLQWGHPMLAQGKEGKLLYPDHHLIWCIKRGFRPAHFPPLLS